MDFARNRFLVVCSHLPASLFCQQTHSTNTPLVWRTHCCCSCNCTRSCGEGGLYRRTVLLCVRVRPDKLVRLALVLSCVSMQFYICNEFVFTALCRFADSNAFDACSIETVHAVFSKARVVSRVYRERYEVNLAVDKRNFRSCFSVLRRSCDVLAVDMRTNEHDVLSSEHFFAMFGMSCGHLLLLTESERCCVRGTQEERVERCSSCGSYQT